jgi:hypothetical protein
VEDAVETRDVRVQFCLPVVAFDLRGQRVPGEPQSFHEGLGHLLPVSAGNGRNMRCVGAGCAVDLAQVLRPGDPVQLAGQAVRGDCQFLAEGSGGCGLAVGAGQHGDGAVVLCHFADLGHECTRRGKPHVLHSALDAQRVGEVVDVLGGAAEVHHGRQVFDADRRQAAADVVLHCLHVVDRDGLDFGQLGNGGGVEFGDDGAELLLLRGRQRPRAGKDVVAGQVDEPLHFHGHAVAVEGCLGQVVNEGRDGGLVAAVQRAKRDFFRGRGEGQAS